MFSHNIVFGSNISVKIYVMLFLGFFNLKFWIASDFPSSVRPLINQTTSVLFIPWLIKLTLQASQVVEVAYFLEHDSLMDPHLC